MVADSYADMLERLFIDYERRWPLELIGKIARQCRADLRGQTSPGATPELLERLVRQRLDAHGNQ